MKTNSRIARAILAMILTATPVLSAPEKEGAEASGAAAAEIAPVLTGTDHQKLCKMLGIVVGGRYEFLLGGNEIHYWEIRSLGANGWILCRDSRYYTTWVNISNVVSVTRISKASQPRPEKRGERK